MQKLVLLLLLSAAPLLGQTSPAASEAPASDPQPAAEPQSKVTIGVYHSPGATVEDLNLRHQAGAVTGWVGAYRNEERKLEGRAGIQLNWQRGIVLVQPMVQGGTTRFVQGSVYSEVGTRWLGIAGFSRTNLKPQDDLTFDPNNSIQAGFGWTNGERDRATFWTIKDDRLGTRQQMSHAIWKHRLDAASALTIDVFYKSGLTDSGRMIHSGGAGLYYDRGWFAKLYVDPFASFGDTRQVRLSFGRKF